MMKRCPKNHINIKGVCVSKRLHKELLSEDGVSVQQRYLNESEEKSIQKLRRKKAIVLTQPLNLPRAKGWRRYRYKDYFYPYEEIIKG